MFLALHPLSVMCHFKRVAVIFHGVGRMSCVHVSHRSDPGSRTVTFSSTAHRPGSLVAMDGACLMVTYDLIMRSASLHFAEPSYAIYSPLI